MKKFYIVVVFLHLSLFSYSQYQIINYTTYNTGENSLGSNTIYLIDEDPVSHEMYFSCIDGIMKLNNGEYEPVQPPLYLGWYGSIDIELSNHREFDLDINGNLWFGINDSIYRYNNTQIESFPIPTITSNFNDVLCDQQGNVWIARSNGLFKFDGTNLIAFTTLDGLLSDAIYCLYEDDNGNIWAGSNLGMDKYDGTIWKSYSNQQGINWSNNQSSVQCISEDINGTIWIGGREVAYLSGENFELVYPDSVLSVGFDLYNINSIACDQSGTLWFGTNDFGIFFKSGNSWERYTEQNGLGSNQVRSIFVDSQDRVWVGQEAGGLNILENGTWMNISTNSGLAENFVFDIFEDTTQSMWFSSTHGLSFFDHTSWSSYFTKYTYGVIGDVKYNFDMNLCVGGELGQFYKRENNVWDTIFFVSGFDFTSDYSGDYWIATGTSTIHFSEQPYTIDYYTTTEGLPSNRCYCIERDSSGNIWVGTQNGIAKFTGTNFSTVTIPNDDFGNRIYDIRTDYDNNVWFASDHGAAKYDGNSNWQFFFQGDGLAGNVVQDFEISSDSSIWFACFGGVSILSDSILNSITKEDGLISNYIYCIEEDHLGNMWFGTWKGVSELMADTTNSNGIHFSQQDNNLNLYPNPASNKLYFKSGDSGIVKIYSLSGQVLLETNMLPGQNQMDITSLQPGNYLLQAVGNKRSRVGKFVVLR